MLTYLLITLLISLAINGVMFLIAYRYRTDKLTDISYALTFITLGIYGLFSSPPLAFHLILFGMICLWAIRLGGFLLFRIWRTGRDSRFDAMRSDFWKFAKFWASQGLAVWVVLTASLLAFRVDGQITWSLAWMGIIIWLVGLVLEATADIQKYRFNTLPANRNRWIATGIWRYSRHPNYMGEILVWTGVYLYCCSIFDPLNIMLGLISPLFIAILLLFVSGIPVLEKSADKKWGEQAAYQNYKKQTSILIPWPPKKS